jgi:hypothetical protein
MATMIAEVYDALVAAGAPEEKARKAAEAVASFESRFSKYDADMNVLKWMMGFNLAFSVAIIARLFG